MLPPKTKYRKEPGPGRHYFQQSFAGFLGFVSNFSKLLMLIRNIKHAHYRKLGKQTMVSRVRKNTRTLGKIIQSFPGSSLDHLPVFSLLISHILNHKLHINSQYPRPSLKSGGLLTLPMLFDTYLLLSHSAELHQNISLGKKKKKRKRNQ